MAIPKCDAITFWINKACGSEYTAKRYLRTFTNFCKYNSLNPDALIQKWKAVRYDWVKRQEFLDEWSEKIEAYVYNELKDFTPYSKLCALASILSFFKHHKIHLEVATPKHPYVVYHNKDITKEQIKRILQYSNIRDKTFYLMMLESGLRPVTLCKLKYKHIKEDFEAKRIPIKIDTPAEILKDRVGHRFSFIGVDGANVLREYLRPKQPLSDEAYIFTRLKRGKNDPVQPASISVLFGRLVIKLGLAKPVKPKKPRSIRLYCLRKYFRNNIKIEDGAYREFWMGHTFGTDEHYLTRNVEKHRKVYSEAYPSIRIYQPQTELSVEKLKERITRELRTELRAEYEAKLEEQIREMIQEEMRQMIESDSQTRYVVEDFVQTQLGVKPEKVSYSVAISEDNKKTITVLGYWSDGRYVKLEQPAKIVTQ